MTDEVKEVAKHYLEYTSKPDFTGIRPSEKARRIISSLADEVTRLERELNISKGFRDVAVRERDAERYKNELLQKQVKRLEAEREEIKELCINAELFGESETLDTIYGLLDNDRPQEDKG